MGWLTSTFTAVLTGLRDPAWAAILVSSLSALFTAISLAFVIADRRQRARSSEPAVEVRATPDREHDGWWFLSITVRNYWRTSLEVERLAVRRPKGAMLLAYETRRADRGDLKPPDVTLAKREITFRMTLQPTGRRTESQIPILHTSDQASAHCCLRLPPHMAAGSADLLLTARRKDRRDKVVSIPFRVELPKREPHAQP